MTIEDSTVSGNQAGGSGGGINLGYVSDPVVIENSTISGNSADAYGGGVRSTYNRYDRMRSVRNSTITDNSADVGGGVFTSRYDSPDYSGDDDFNLSSTIVAGNSATTEGDDLGAERRRDRQLHRRLQPGRGHLRRDRSTTPAAQHLRRRPPARPAGRQRRPDPDPAAEPDSAR